MAAAAWVLVTNPSLTTQAGTVQSVIVLIFSTNLFGTRLISVSFRLFLSLTSDAETTSPPSDGPARPPSGGLLTHLLRSSSEAVGWPSWSIDQFHQSQNAPVPYPRMLHSEQKCLYFCSDWSILGYGTGTSWDLWIRSIRHRVHMGACDGKFKTLTVIMSKPICKIWECVLLPITGKCRFNTQHFLKNTHNGHPKAHSIRRTRFRLSFGSSVPRLLSICYI